MAEPMNSFGPRPALPGSGNAQGMELTRKLIAANPDAALERLAELSRASQHSASMITDLNDQLAKEQGSHAEDRNHLERMAQMQAEVERKHAEAMSENQTLKNQLNDSAQQRASLIEGHSELVAAHKATLLAANPELSPALVSGGNLHELNASLDAARSVVAQVQSSMAQNNSASRMRPGSPVRSMGLDASQMSPAQKIAAGVQEARGW